MVKLFSLLATHTVYSSYSPTYGNIIMAIEPGYDKTYNKTCVPRIDSDQSVYPPSMARVLIYPSLDSLEAAEGTCNQ